jgi:transposase InsO family protein
LIIDAFLLKEEGMKKKQRRDRELAVQRYLKGEGLSAIAKSLGYSRRWVYRWVARYHATEAAAEWYEDQSRCPHSNPRQVSWEIVEAVKLARLHLYNQGLFCGAQAITWEMEDLGVSRLPSLRTINRVLNREGLTHRRTGRYEPKGKKYPQLSAANANEAHQTDYVGPCYLRGPVRFYSLNSVDVATGRCAVTPVLSKAGQETVDAIWSHWCRLGIPEHQQVDNEAVFYGSRRYPRGMGILIRLCLANGVEPWFIPPAEPWRNGVVEKFNDHYRQGFLRREDIKGAIELGPASLVFEQKHNSRYRYSKLHGRTPQAALQQNQRQICFPAAAAAPRYPLPKPESGYYHLVRFIRSDALFDVFGERFRLPPETVYEYAVATVDVTRQKLSVSIAEMTVAEFDYALR